MKKKLTAFILIAAMVLGMSTTAFAAGDAANDLVVIGVAGEFYQTEARSMLDMINSFRTGKDAWYWNEDDTTKTELTDLKKFTYDYELEQIAMVRALEIAISFSHTRPNGTSCFTASSGNTYTYGENIAAGQPSAASVFKSWQETDDDFAGQGHRRNMLNSNFTAIGIGHVVYNGYHYWVQEFGYANSGAEETKPLNEAGLLVTTVEPTAVEALEVELAENNIDKLAIGETVEVPDTIAYILLKGTWPGDYYCAVYAIPEITVDGQSSGEIDLSTVSTDDGDVDVIVGKKVGQVTLNFTVTMGSLSKTVPLEIIVTPASIEKATVTLSRDSYTYTGQELKPEVTVELDGKELTQDVDYTVAYTDNVGTADKDSTGTVVVTGMGNYEGTLETTFQIALCDHDYEVSVTEPTCSAEGSKTYTCKKCGSSYSEKIDKIAHTEEIMPGKAPACSETGLTEGKRCSVCGEILTKQEEIPATGHTEEIIPGKAATCTEGGLTDGKKCSVCGEVLTAQEEIPAAGHTEEIIPGKAATCTESGLTDGKKCSVCGEILTEQEEIPAAGHKEETVEAEAATCTEPGHSAGIRCSVCGEMLDGSEITPALGHDYDNGVITKEPTCTEKGIKTYTCGRCGDSYTEPIETVAHTEVTVNGKAASCTETGLTDGIKCSVCGVILKEQEVIPALGHTEELIPGKEPTCTESGLTEGKKCSVCGEILVSQTTIPAAGHSYGEWMITKEATWDEDGEEERTCSVCGEKETRAINKGSYGHQDDFSVEGEVIKEATCLEAGSQIMRCSNPNCKNTTTVEIPALGHDFSEPVITPATCTEDGTSVKTCTRCGEKETTILPASGHQYIWEVTKKATKTTPGLETGICSVCGEVITKELAYQDIVYEIIYGAGSSWTQESDGSIKIGANGDFSKLESVMVDGQIVDPKCYKAESGSTYITFEKAYMETLSVGSHTCRIVYEDGYAETNFTVAERKKEAAAGSTKPSSGDKGTTGQSGAVNTGDEANVLTLMVIMALSFGAVVWMRRRRQV